jgi:hypothetical protein
MDLSKFHFELRTWNDIVIRNLPNSTELLLVLKGRMINGYRYLRINNGTGAGAVGVGSDTYLQPNGALYLGNTGGWGSMYLTAEIKFIEEKHVLISTTQDTKAHKPDNSTTAGHTRKYAHYNMSQDYFNTITLGTDGMLANGTTVEVYSK